MPSWPKDPDRFRPRKDSSGHLFLFINGILDVVEDNYGWTDRAERWFARHTRHEYDAQEHFSSAILGVFGANRTVLRASEIIANYRAAGVRHVHLVGHSHGCEIARRVILASDHPIDSAHFYAPAVERDFIKNGLNDALFTRHLGWLSVHGSASDTALLIARFSLGLHGSLGRYGAENLSWVAKHRSAWQWREGFGHSTWFEPPHFNATMRGILEQARAGA